ncbi:MAG: cupredoxin domain-containing protein [Vulcanimicrobiaceae bacterium]
MRWLLAMACIALISACTPGASESTASGSATGSSVVTIDVNLTLNHPTSSPQGLCGGYRLAVTTVSVGTAIRFVNSDSFAHTASSIGNATTFPASSPLSTAALQQNGATLSQGWSTGSLQPGAMSQVVIADKPGTYLYGCFYHYGSPMRAVIIVQ